MSKAEILEQLPKLTKEERKEIRRRLAELDPDEWWDEDDPLSDDEKALIEERIAAHERDPANAVPWEEFEARLKQRLGE